MKNRYLKIAALTGFFCLLVSLFLSCSSSSHGESFTSYLDEVDSYIYTGNTKDAVRLLKSIEKKAYSSYERLGVYKRYLQLGENNSAEEVLTQGLKKLSDNPELCAVYSVFLMRNGRTAEAYEYSLKLLDTNYSSINSECMLRLALEEPYNADLIFSGKGFNKKTRKAALKAFKKSQKEAVKLAAQKAKAEKRNKKKSDLKTESEKSNIKSNIFFDVRFIPVYENAWKGSRDSQWLYNAAVIYMHSGNFEKACSFFPKIDSNWSWKDSVFWGRIFYDSAKYAQSLECLLAGEKSAAEETALFDLLALESDNYYILGDDENSHKVRTEIISKWKTLNESDTINLYKTDLKLSVENAYLNNGIYYAAQHNEEERYVNLYSLVNEFPMFENGLSAFASYAIEISRRPPEDELLTFLRQKNLKTLEMEKREKNPFVEVEEAVRREDEAISTYKTPLLVVSREMLEDELHREDLNAKLISRVWTVIERNTDDNGNIDNEIVHYAISKLVQNNDIENARQLYEKYTKNVSEEDMLLWQLEYKAWFAALDGNIKVAYNIYSGIIEKYSGRSPAIDSEGKNAALINSYVNLAAIYGGIDRSYEALEMLNKASSRCNNGETKSEILYRMAEISYGLGDERNAIRSLQYAINLNGKNKKARLLLKKLQGTGSR